MTGLPGTDISETSFETLKRRSRWLGEYAQNFQSQTGEDGIISKALSMLPERNRWSVEFGAWDGKHFSNTYPLVERDGYQAVLIEGDEKKYQSLCTNYPFKDRGHFIHGFVGWEADDNLDTMLAKTAVPKDFDFLSIDIDGNDAHVWKAVKQYRPKLVLIESNPTASNRIDFVQPPDGNCNLGNSPAAMVRIGKEKGYELISVTGPNLLFVDAKYYGIFGIPDNSLSVMRDETDVTSLFLGFDGTVMMDGPGDLPWHGGKVKIKQVFPKILRRYPPNYSKFQKLLFRMFEKVR